MAKVELAKSWLFELDSTEARLMLRALGGRLKPAEVEEAKQLGNRLTELRAAEAKTLADQMEGHVRAMKEEADASSK